jgi:hypothetical protein
MDHLTVSNGSGIMWNKFITWKNVDMSNVIDDLKTSSPQVPGFLLKKKTEKGNTVSKIKNRW